MNKVRERYEILDKLTKKAITFKDASKMLSLSERQIRRILKAYQNEGIKTLEHGNKNRMPSNAIDKKIKNDIVDLYKTKYEGKSQMYMKLILQNKYKINISKSSIGRIINQAGPVMLEAK